MQDFDKGEQSKDEFLADCLAIRPEDISGEFRKMPGVLSYWNARYSDALEVYLRARATRKQVYGETYLEIKRATVDAKPRATEATLESAIQSDEAYRDAVEAENQAEANKARMYGVLDAVRAKKDMLMSLGAMLRAEMGADPYIRDLVAGNNGSASSTENS